MPRVGSLPKMFHQRSLPTLMHVMMLGARGVGKTSLLTSMYEQLKPVIDAAHLQLTPDDESAARLGERLAELKSLPETFEATGGIEGNQDFREYTFGLGKIGHKPDMELQFTDCPGGALLSDAPAVQKERIRELVRTCQVIVVAIDAPALMEQLIPERDKEGRVIRAEGKWNERVNKVFQITAMFKNYYRDLQEDRLILLVPVKCERYLDDPKTAEFMRRLIRESYRELLAFLRTMGQRVAIAITPVQTVGCVKFWSIRVENGLPVFIFRSLGPNATYSPKDNEQPLRYILRFFVREYHRARMSGIFGPIYWLLGKYHYLLEAAQSLQAGCKDEHDPSHAFEIIQGDDVL